MDFLYCGQGELLLLRCEGFSLGWLLLLWSVGSAAVAHGLGCSQACGISRNEGSNLWPLHWQATFIHCTSRKVQKRTFLNLVRGSLCILCILSDPPGADLTKALFLREAHHRHDSQVEFLKQDLLSKERGQGSLLKSWTSARKRGKTVTGLLGSEASLACRVRRLEPVEGGQEVHRWPGMLNAFACEVVTTTFSPVLQSLALQLILPSRFLKETNENIIMSTVTALFWAFPKYLLWIIDNICINSQYSMVGQILLPPLHYKGTCSVESS